MKKLLLIVVSMLLIFSSSLFALEIKPFSEDLYKSHTAEGETVLLDFHASWCPTCKKQSLAFEAISATGSFKDVTVLKADYDKEKELKEKYNVRKQSTLILLKSGKEVQRVIGKSSVEDITALLNSAS